MAAAGRYRQWRWKRREVGQLNQRVRIQVPVRDQTQRHRVATVFALGANDAADPPDGRMIEQERFDETLEQIDQIIVPFDVAELVREQRLDLVQREPGCASDR